MWEKILAVTMISKEYESEIYNSYKSIRIQYMSKNLQEALRKWGYLNIQETHRTVLNHISTQRNPSLPQAEILTTICLGLRQMHALTTTSYLCTLFWDLNITVPNSFGHWSIWGARGTHLRCLWECKSVKALWKTFWQYWQYLMMWKRVTVLWPRESSLKSHPRKPVPGYRDNGNTACDSPKMQTTQEDLSNRINRGGLSCTMKQPLE